MSKRLHRFPQQGKSVQTICGKTIHPWMPLKIINAREAERTELEVECLKGERYRIPKADVVLFPNIVTITREHDGHDVCTTFDVIHDHEVQETGFIIAQCPKKKVVVRLPSSIVEEAAQHLPPKEALAV